MDKGWKNYGDNRKNLECFLQIVSTKVDANNCASEDSEGSEELTEKICIVENT